MTDHLGHEQISVFVPTTPNITAGFFLIVPRSDTIELHMSVDQALKYIISMGVAEPPRPGARPEGTRLRDRPQSGAVAENVGGGGRPGFPNDRFPRSPRERRTRSPPASEAQKRPCEPNTAD